MTVVMSEIRELESGFPPFGGFGSPPKMEVMRRMKVDFPHPESAASPITTVLLLTCTTAGRTEAWLPERCTEATNFGCTRVKEDAPLKAPPRRTALLVVFIALVLAYAGAGMSRPFVRG
mmetsp:Transcript_6980/g.42765  ORF Transcript_6980/g.42765 Transcript_6980/m.42765 type:complete len:119 (-) Transcript_6980:58-414(-)